jgi:hypothetical protein
MTFSAAFRTTLWAMVLVTGWASAGHARQDEPPYKSGRYPQEMAAQYTTTNDGRALDDITSLFITDGSVVAVGAAETWFFNGEQFAHTAPMKPGQTDALTAPDIEDGLGRIWQGSKSRAVARDSTGKLWFGVQAGVARETESGWQFFEGKDGLPYTNFTCAAAGPDGAVWFGTEKGIVRWSNGAWQYRQGLRWLPDDAVRAIAVDEEGGGWVATAKGIGRIYFTPMTLREKADYYEKDMDLIRRTPFGYTSEVSVKTPGDKSEVRQHDSDNDGLWTSMYGAGECFAYGATGEAVFKERAKQAFEALRFLQVVTQGGDPAPPKGYVARTILPTSGPDPNEGRVERDKEEAKEDKLWKVYENRWPRSADGEWYWKSDTSSDELDGHYFFYPAYYDLCADTDAEKARVRELVGDLTDHLIAHEFRLMDHDGRPTRWAIYGPNDLNHTEAWWHERGLNSLSILSYLTVAGHITGDDKYEKELEKLITEHAYDMNAMVPKIQFGVGSGNQSDNEMAIMSFYNLVKYTKNEKLKNIMRYSFYQLYSHVQPERNPFFNFAYAAVGRGQTYENIWGTFPISPYKGWLTDSVDTLKGFSLERFDWPMDNTHRLDVVMLPWQQQGRELYYPPVVRRGHGVDGKVLPIENRFVNHWNHDPWELNHHGQGRMMASGAAYLLPYYFGLYLGFIEETE